MKTSAPDDDEDADNDDIERYGNTYFHVIRR